MELKKRVPGAGRAAGLVVLLCLLAMLGGVGCETTTPASTVVAEPASLPDAETLIEASAARMSAISYASFALVHDVGSSYLGTLGLNLETVTGQIAMPDRYSLRMEATTANRNAFVVVEVIGVEGTSYMSLLGRWGETDPTSLPFNFSSLGLRLADIMRAIEESKVVAEEEIENVPVWHIAGVVDSGDFRGLLVNASPGETIKLDAWIGQDDSLLHKARVEGKLFSDDQVGAVRVLTITAVDVPVDIEAPPL